MKAKPKNSWNSWRRPAFTLVEVVASLMLMGTLLVGILVAHRRHAQQIRRAQARLVAVAAADKLLMTWSEQGNWGAAAKSGRCGDASSLMWRWTVLPTPELSRLGAAIGRLEIVEESASECPLVQLDILTTGDGPLDTRLSGTP